MSKEFLIRVFKHVVYVNNLITQLRLNNKPVTDEMLGRLASADWRVYVLER